MDAGVPLDVLGESPLIDILRRPSLRAHLADEKLATSEFNAEATPPYNGDDVAIKFNGVYEIEGYRKFELPYFPDADQLYGKYYVEAPYQIDEVAPKISGLPDLRDKQLVVRIYSRGRGSRLVAHPNTLAGASPGIKLERRACPRRPTLY